MTTTRKITSEFLPTTPARTHLTADELQGHLALILQEGKRAVELASQSGGSLVVGESDPTPSWLESINLLRQVFGPSEKVSEVASNAVWHDQELVRVTADLLVAVVDSLEYFVAVSDFIRIAARNGIEPTRERDVPVPHSRSREQMTTRSTTASKACARRSFVGWLSIVKIAFERLRSGPVCAISASIVRSHSCSTTSNQPAARD